MKLVASLLLIGALCLLGLFVPLEGETGLSRARRDGFPAACAQTLSKTVHLGFRWAVRAVRGSPAPAPAPQRATTPRRQLARAAISPAPPGPAGAQRDHIVAAKPAERLDEKDRDALDKLITARSGR